MKDNIPNNNKTDSESSKQDSWKLIPLKDLKDFELPEEELLKKINEHHIPHYILDNYKYSYVSPKMVNFLDNPSVVFLRSFFQSGRLHKEVVNQLDIDNKVLFIGHPYGTLLNKSIEKIGKNGWLDLIDVIPYQIQKAAKKLQHHNNVDMWLQDAYTPLHREYNVICLYFLLSSVPDGWKTQILNNVFDVIDEFNCKVIIADYTLPHFLNPIFYVYSFLNTFFKPYAKSMLDSDIKNFSKKSYKYNWETKYLFGRSFQVTTVSAKQKLQED